MSDEYEIKLKKEYKKEELVSLIKDLQTFRLFYSHYSQYYMTMYGLQENLEKIDNSISVINHVIDNWDEVIL